MTIEGVVGPAAVRLSLVVAQWLGFEPPGWDPAGTLRGRADLSDPPELGVLGLRRGSGTEAGVAGTRLARDEARTPVRRSW